MTQNEFVILVDENDQELGTAEKISAHKNAQCHRAFSVFITRQKNNQTEILLQQRHPDKYHCGGLWTNTCCSHPRPGETTKDGAQRRLFEEMGIRAPLKYLGKFHYIAEFDNGLTENEVDHVFSGTINTPDFAVNPIEVADFKWISLENLQHALKTEPKTFTPWLSKALTIFSDS